MNSYYKEFVDFLVEASESTDEFMKGEKLPFGETTKVHKGPIYKALLEPSEHDGLVEIILKVLLSALAKTARLQFKDHIEG